MRIITTAVSFALGLAINTAGRAGTAGPTFDLAGLAETAGPTFDLANLAETAGPTFDVAGLAETAGPTFDVAGLAETAGPTFHLANLAGTAGPTFDVASLAETAGRTDDAATQGPETGTEIRLWSGAVPFATGTGPEDTPALTVYRPAPGTATGAAVIVLPGGGYRGRAAHEGEPIARWLNSVGVTAFVARYRVSPYRHPAPATDAARAIQYVRAHATEWQLDPARIGILGFSAGGHLASTAATQFVDAQPDATDPVARVSSRPDLAILIYPVITFTDEPFVHKGSRTNLLGPDPTPEQMAAMSSERRVTSRTPPVFLIHTTGDTGVPPENSLLFVQAMRKAGVEVELHLYEGGRHGFGLGEKEGPIATWPVMAGLWLHKHGFARETMVAVK